MHEAQQQRMFHAVAWGVLLATAALLACLSWNAWGDPIIDLGREVYVPWQLREGRVLYRDLIYNYGPVAPYLMAGITALLDGTLGVFAATGAAIGIATMAGLYATGCRMGSLGAGFAAAMLFTLHSFFGYSTWGCNYVLPYAYAATLSMALAVWSLYALLGYLYHGRRRRDLYLGATLMIATLLTKQEVGFAIAGTWLAAACIHRVGWRDVGLVAAMIVAAGVGFLIIFAARKGEHALLDENLLRFAGAGNATSFFKTVAGFDRWRYNPLDISAYQVALPLALILAIAARRQALGLLAAFTLLCAPRVLFAFDPAWYGFYLFVPGYLLLAYAAGRWRSRAGLAVLIVLAGIIAWRFNSDSFHAYRAKTHTLTTSKGLMRIEPDGRAAAIHDFLAFMAEHSARGETLVVLSEGATLNWWTGLPNPTAYYTFIPPEFTDPAVEQRIVAELESTKPTFIATNPRPLEEFGYRDLAYMPAIMDYVHKHYELAGPDHWPIRLLRRKNP